MATEADDRQLAAGKLAKAIRQAVGVNIIGRPPGWCRAGGEDGQHPEPTTTTATTVTPVADVRSHSLEPPCPDQAAAESAEKTSGTMAANPKR
jgi:hypothetical protein